MTDDTDKPENSGPIQDTRFKPGQSGNPAGKPKGARHRATQAMMTLLEGEAQGLTRKAIDLALEGDTTALRICIDRITPTLKSTAPMIALDIPATASLAETANAFIAAAASGDMPPDIAAQMVAAIAGVARVAEIETVKHRLEALERAITVKPATKPKERNK